MPFSLTINFGNWKSCLGMHGSGSKNDGVIGRGEGSRLSNFKKWGRKKEGKYFDREINKEAHTPNKSDVSLKDAKVTGPFSDYQKGWIAGLMQTKGLFW